MPKEKHVKNHNAVLIEDIEREQDKTLYIEIEAEIKELENCNVKADLEFKSLGGYIEVSGHVDGKVTLECDRCLNKYEYDLDFDIDETYAKHSLHDEYSQEVELQSGQFITDLNGAKEIDIYDLLYQSVILQLPNKKVCGINCNEGLFVSDEDMEIHDDRMDVFKNIQINPK